MGGIIAFDDLKHDKEVKTIVELTHAVAKITALVALGLSMLSVYIDLTNLFGAIRDGRV